MLLEHHPYLIFFDHQCQIIILVRMIVELTRLTFETFKSSNYKYFFFYASFFLCKLSRHLAASFYTFRYKEYIIFFKNIKRDFLKAIKEFVYEIIARRIRISTLNQGLQKVQICKQIPYMKKKKNNYFFFYE
jgi:hypothetical protein